MNELIKFFVYISIIVCIYTLENFVLLKFKYIEGSTYLWVLVFNISICVFLSYIKKGTEEVSSKLSYDFSVLLLCVWLILYEVLIGDTLTSKIIGASLVMGSISFFSLCSIGNWPYRTTEGKLFLENNKLYCTALLTFNWFFVISGGLLLLFGEWVWRL